MKLSSLDVYRAEYCTPEVIDKYYTELESILDEYNLKSNPQAIYNIDEKGIPPPHVICDTKLKPQAVTSPRLTVTVIGCGNALGTQILPYFVFPGKGFQSDLLEGATPGSNGTVSQTGSG